MGNCKKVLSAIFVLFSLYSFKVFAQVQNVSEDSVVSISESSENENSSVVSESSILLNSSTNDSNEQKSTSNFWLFFRMILVLAIVIACIYGVMWFMKKNMKTEVSDDQFLRQVAWINVAPGKSVQVVSLLDHAYIIGVAENSINLISEVQDKELIDAMNLYADKHKNTKKPRTFAEILDIFMPGGPKDKKNVFNESESKISDMFKRQQERIENGE